MSPNPAAGRVEQLAQAIAARVVNIVLEAIDVNALVAKVDVDALVKQVDVESIIERVDVDAIVQRVDVDAIVKRVDINAIVSSMDIDSLVEKTELGAIIARSTTGVFTEVLDVIRAQGVGLDDFCARWANRILRRPLGTLPAGPGLPPAPATQVGTPEPPSAPPPEAAGPALSMPPSELTVERQGQYAGAVSRLAAFALDVGASWGVYVAASALLSFAVQLLTGHSFDLAKHPVVAISVLAVWLFAYFAYQWAVAGRTIGMAVFGIRVVRADGGPTNGRAAVIRTLTLPLSIVVFFIGFLGILANRQRQAWHDRFAGTAVVYAWDARAACLRWLADRETPAAA
jgi:uncharacterized RDD family membrane protein YckC